MPYSKRLPRRNLSVFELKESLREDLRLDLNGWEILGEIMVIELPEGYTSGEKRLIGERIIELHPKARTVINRRSIEDEFREPWTEIIAGGETETVYHENGCSFKIDPTKVMFSFGNKEERKRMASISSERETVVDMFSCVGQFAIPLAKYSKPKKVYAIEKNPAAFEYLKKNIVLNKLSNIEGILGDCREAAPVGVADRVIMGYLFGTEGFLSTALNSLKAEGVVHYHCVSGLSEIDVELEKIQDIIRKNGFKTDWVEKIRVKSYAPRRYHWVMDIKVERE